MRSWQKVPASTLFASKSRVTKQSKLASRFKKPMSLREIKPYQVYSNCKPTFILAQKDFLHRRFLSKLTPLGCPQVNRSRFSRFLSTVGATHTPIGGPSEPKNRAQTSFTTFKNWSKRLLSQNFHITKSKMELYSAFRGHILTFEFHKTFARGHFEDQ